MADDRFDAFTVRRNAKGEVEPYEVSVPNVRPEGEEAPTIKILPTTIASLKGLSDPEGDAVKWPIEDKVRYIREHVVEPPFGELEPEEIMSSMTMWDLDMILIAAVQHGGPMRQRNRRKDPTIGSGRSKKTSRR